MRDNLPAAPTENSFVLVQNQPSNQRTNERTHVTTNTRTRVFELARASATQRNAAQRNATQRSSTAQRSSSELLSLQAHDSGKTHVIAFVDTSTSSVPDCDVYIYKQEHVDMGMRAVNGME